MSEEHDNSLRGKLLRMARANHRGLVSFTVAVGTGPKDGRISGGQGYLNAARKLEREGVLRLVDRHTDREADRGNVVVYRTYTFEKVD